jgi:hypothetical protein
MKTFDIHRFGKVLKWTIYYNKSTLTKITMGFFIAFLAIYFLTTDLFFSSSSSFPNRLNSAAGVTFGMFFVFLFLTPSWILSNMKNRKSSLDYLMLPATNLEKFLARIVMVTVFYTLCVVAAQIAADLIQWIISMFRYPVSQTGLISTDILENHYISFGGHARGFNSCYARGNMLVLIWIIWMHSVYTLGGTVFRKCAWIITSLLLLVLGIIVVWSGFGFGFEIALINDGVIITLMFLVFAGLNYYMSYKVFSRIQLINNKWINL